MDARFPSARERRGSASGVKFQIRVSFGSAWPRLLLAATLAMRPGWPRLALRSLVRTVPAWPRGGHAWPHHEWPGVANLLIQLHSVAFRCISYRLRGAGMRGSRLHGHDVCEQCSNQRGYGVMGSCRWFGGLARPYPPPAVPSPHASLGDSPSKGATGHTLTLTLSQRARGSYRQSYAKVASREKEPQGAGMRGSPPSQGTVDVR